MNQKSKRPGLSLGNRKLVGIGSIVAIFGLLGIAMAIGAHAATYVVPLEAESNSPTGNAKSLSGQTGTSGGGMVKFGSGTTVSVPPTPPTPPTGTAKYPADISGPNWKITLPTAGAPEIKPPQYATYSDQYFSLNAVKNGIVFKAYFGGGTTQNSSNTRSELRERYNNDPEGYWNAGSGTHTMEVVGQVNRLTKVKPHVVIAQVHDAKDDTSVWRVEGKTLYITAGNDTHHCTVDTNLTLGKKYTLKYVLTAGKYEYYYNGTKVNCVYSNSNTSYFKAGNYLQSNPSDGKSPGESTSEYSEVVIYSVKVTHS